MATLENIRKRGPLVATVIGLALLAFILGDLLNSGTTLFSSGRYEVAEIAGQSVHIQEYQNKIEELTEMYKSQYGGAVDAGLNDRVRNDVWEQLVQNYVMKKEYEATGVGVHSEEVFDMVQGQSISPMIRNLFTNPQTGAFNPQDVVNYLQNIKFDKTGAAKAQWLYIEKELLSQRVYQKYQNLIAKGLYVTENQAKREMEGRSKVVSISYIAQVLTSVAPEKIKVTDADIKKYYKEHKKKFKQERAADIAYVSFDVTPSAEDQLKAEEDIKSLLNEFTSTENAEQFVNANSDAKFDPTNYKKEDLSANIAEFAFSQPLGSVFGPYFENGTFKLSKITNRKMVPDSIKARHILVSVNNTVTAEAAQAKADSLKKLIQSGTAFAELAMVNSDDKGSAMQGGDLNWFTEGRMVREFNDACFSAKKGELLTVKTQFGIHLIEVTDIGTGSEKAQLATLVHEVNPSTKTFQAFYNSATEFANSIKKSSDFDTIISQKRLEKRIAGNLGEMDFNIAGLEQPRELISWVFKGEKGDISKVYELGNRFVVAQITELKEKGFASIESVKPQIEAILTTEMQGAFLAEEFKKAAEGQNNLTAIASKLQLEVKNADNISFSAFAITGAGNEPKLIGTVSNLEKGRLSKPIIGTNAVYIAIVNEITENPATQTATEEQLRMQRSIAGRAGFQSYEALRQASEINDLRSKFF